MLFEEVNTRKQHRDGHTHELHAEGCKDVQKYKAEQRGAVEAETPERAVEVWQVVMGQLGMPYTERSCRIMPCVRAARKAKHDAKADRDGQARPGPAQ